MTSFDRVEYSITQWSLVCWVVSFRVKSNLRSFESLQDILTKTDFETDTWHVQRSIVVGHPSCWNCSVCPLNIKTTKINFPNLGFSHHYFSNCRTKMCVYLLICKCKLRYVDSTQRPLKIRLQEHRSRIKHEILEAPLTQHCLEMKHDFKDFQCIVLEVVTTNAGMHSDLNKRLLQRETFRITKLKTLTPGGLNQEVNFNVF